MNTFTIGHFFEEATAVLTHGKLLDLGPGRGYCPDVWADPVHIECKAIGRSNRAILYEDRVRRQAIWELGNTPIQYVFWKHNTKCKGIRGRQQLRTALARGCSEALVLPQSAVHALLTSPASTINRGNPAGYQKGWSPKYEALRALTSIESKQTICLPKQTLKVTIRYHVSLTPYI